MAVYAGRDSRDLLRRRRDQIQVGCSDGMMAADAIGLRSAVSGLVQHLSCAELLARSIAQIEVGSSVSAVFDGSNHIF
ncbi:hypothetical protein I4I73_31000 [Pseudonocardia sp. KRD-184]|uniref:Uncharacterized protein n=1 Tax=Pseudonocardia oceani TaxID=2792013 RepID=A0ABS6U939_9PSEU|nr:hypothetical protein [Pseudonocardia oceani]MBW0093775.1 hypothetical protein [Pseudonocardia oceani]MBW0100414.1 hypothetical protein [Pseudonocardia oceani]MBW0113150.1 hypothetical protein [Pseudonocardia oceani]MBW0125934.1 hypothetical protein [Pseudonocardia oceani]MBW0128441.1 hypothetical protein [Pseudonocardia oceani]